MSISIVGMSSLQRQSLRWWMRNFILLRVCGFQNIRLDLPPFYSGGKVRDHGSLLSKDKRGMSAVKRDG